MRPSLRIRVLGLTLCLAAAAAITGAAPGTGPAGLDGEAQARLTQRFEEDVRILASDAMEGRGVGTDGLEQAADWIEARLKGLQLAPAFGQSYRQPFRLKTGVALENDNSLEGMSRDDWTPLGFSSSGMFDGEIAFVGYGLAAPPVGYDELTGVDLRGKVALMLRYEPQERDNASPFAGRRPSRWSALRYKVHKAREQGAVAVVFVTGPQQDEGQDKLPVLRNDGPQSPAGLPVVQIRTSAARRLLEPAGINLEAFQEAVDRDLLPRSRHTTGVRLKGRVAVKATYAQTNNIAGVLRGRGALQEEVVVVGAHYDHLGYGGRGSMRPNQRSIHNGADDNASGTAGVLLAAERLRSLLAQAPERRTVLFALFSGEESGLAGSASFMADPPFPARRIVAMINLDMVGRLRENKLAALGADSAAEWKAALERLAGPLGLVVSARGDGYGPSDQTSFYAERVPVLHFFTGTHEQYHTPEDDVATLNPAGGVRVAELTARLTEELARGHLTPNYVRAVQAPSMGGDSRGYGAYLGTVPDYRSMESAEGGVLLADVRAGGPADQAGLRGGDILVELADTRIDNLYDMTYALQDNKPGQTVNVVALRKGRRVQLQATLGSRSALGRAAASSEQAHAAAAPGKSPHAAHQAPAPAHASPTTLAAHEPAKGPHQGHAAPSSSPGGAEYLPAFYRKRPGPDFKIEAGQPFAARFEGETHLADVRQLTFGGENAEAYFSPDGTRLIYQATLPSESCDQQYVLDLDTGATAQVSSGEGRTTCGYFDFPEADRIIFSSTAGAGPECPPTPDRSRGYVWPVYRSYDLYEAAPDGSGLRRLTERPGYDAEATWCHRGGKLVFTSDRDGDLELYEMDEAGQVRRLTATPGYDGGAFYSPDCSEIVWRASRFEGESLAEYRRLLAQGLVRPSHMELFIMKADGSGVRQLTHTGAANFCPYFHPDGRRIIYSSNAGTANPREFELFLLDKDKQDGAPERITFAPGFDGFPQFSPDGHWFVFASNRANPEGHDTNLFIARWVE